MHNNIIGTLWIGILLIAKITWQTSHSFLILLPFSVLLTEFPLLLSRLMDSPQVSILAFLVSFSSLPHNDWNALRLKALGVSLSLPLTQQFDISLSLTS